MKTEFTLDDMRQLIHDEFQKFLGLQQDADKLLNREEAAEMLGVKSNTLACWAMVNKGPAPTKIGTKSMYLRSILKTYISENTMPR
jgi:hypothetical protein